MMPNGESTLLSMLRCYVEARRISQTPGDGVVVVPDATYRDIELALEHRFRTVSRPESTGPDMPAMEGLIYDGVHVMSASMAQGQLVAGEVACPT